MRSIGGIAFIIGLVLAALISLFSAGMAPAWAVYILGLLGLIVGLLNITDKEIQLFLVASIAFLISFSALSGVFTLLALGWDAVGVFFSLMTVFVAPATAIVAIKALYQLTKD